MAKFNVGIQGVEETNRGVNFNIQVEANDVVSAVDGAKSELLKLLSGAGLGVLTPVSSPAVVALPPTAPAS